MTKTYRKFEYHPLFTDTIYGVVISENNEHVGTMFTPDTALDPFEGIEEVMAFFNVDKETDNTQTINSEQFAEYRTKQIG